LSNIYDVARVRLLKADLDWEAVPLVVVAWGGAVDFNPTDGNVANITARGIATELGTSLPINRSSVSADGSAQTDQVLIPNVPIGQSIVWLTVCEKHPTMPSLNQLILSVDDALEMPFDSNGLDVILNPDWLTGRGWFKP